MKKKNYVIFGCTVLSVLLMSLQATAGCLVDVCTAPDGHRYCCVNQPADSYFSDQDIAALPQQPQEDYGFYAADAKDCAARAWWGDSCTSSSFNPETKWCGETHHVCK